MDTISKRVLSICSQPTNTTPSRNLLYRIAHLLHTPSNMFSLGLLLRVWIFSLLVSFLLPLTQPMPIIATAKKDPPVSYPDSPPLVLPPNNLDDPLLFLHDLSVVPRIFPRVYVYLPSTSLNSFPLPSFHLNPIQSNHSLTQPILLNFHRIQN